MKNTARLFKLFSDETRLRTLMLLTVEELCVCQIMGVLGVSQPLVSRNLAMLSGAGLLNERREGKLVFYSFRKNSPSPLNRIMRVLKEQLKDNRGFREDLESLGDCHEFQKKTGRCDMKTFLEFMERQKKKRKRR
jgi:ArsR family transcriptional regulator